MTEAPRQPSAGRWLWAVTAGLLAFVGAWAVGVGVTILLVRAIPPEVPHPTEPKEGFGDAIKAVSLFFVGTGVSFLVAVVVGHAVSIWVACRHIVRR